MLEPALGAVWIALGECLGGGPLVRFDDQQAADRLIVLVQERPLSLICAALPFR